MKARASRKDIDHLLTLIRPAVRRESVYAVKSYDGLVAKLNQNESATDLPREMKEAVTEKLRLLSWNRYPTDYADPAREALADSLGTAPGNIILSNGSNDLIYAIASTLVASGTPVVLPDPVFSLYGKAIRLQDGDLHLVSCRDDLLPDVHAMVKIAESNAAPLMMLTNPGSPTGTYLPPDAIDRLVAAAPGFVLVDEAYAEFVADPSAMKLIDRHPNLLVLRTFSKAVGLAGLRIGYVVGNAEVIHEIRKVRLPFVLNVLSEATMMAVLENPSFIEKRVHGVVEQRELLFSELSRMGAVDVRPSETNFLIFRTPLSSVALVERMAAEGVLIRDVGGYHLLRNFVRVTVGTPAENQAFLVALKNILQKE